MDLLTVDAQSAIFHALIVASGVWVVIVLLVGKRMPRWTLAIPIATGLFFLYILFTLVTGMKYG